MTYYCWPVVPLCENQLRDVRAEDVLNNGLYRKCDTYRGGGGYDQFPAICEKRLGKRLNKQFVVQLRRCSMCCPYCYVTLDGIWGKPVGVHTEELVQAFKLSGQDVFHLMGGSPALYLDHWHELLDSLPESVVFHSDFVLNEGIYDLHVLKNLAKPNALYAVNIKGFNKEEYRMNTGCAWDDWIFWNNLDVVQQSGINFYFTFTNMAQESIGKFREHILSRYSNTSILDDAFEINLIQYKALEI